MRNKIAIKHIGLNAITSKFMGSLSGDQFPEEKENMLVGIRPTNVFLDLSHSSVKS